MEQAPFLLDLKKKKPELSFWLHTILTNHNGIVSSTNKSINQKRLVIIETFSCNAGIFIINLH